MAPSRAVLEAAQPGLLHPGGRPLLPVAPLRGRVPAPRPLCARLGAGAARRNATLGTFLAGGEDAMPSESAGAWFGPLPFTRGARRVATVQTGSRTFALRPGAARALGLRTASCWTWAGPGGARGTSSSGPRSRAPARRSAGRGSRARAGRRWRPSSRRTSRPDGSTPSPPTRTRSWRRSSATRGGRAVGSGPSSPPTPSASPRGCSARRRLGSPRPSSGSRAPPSGETGWRR